MESWLKRLVVAFVIIVIIVAIYGIYNSNTSNTSKKETLVIYTYPSLFQYGSNPNATYANVFTAFEKKYNVNIDIEYQDNLLATLNSQKSNPQADIVIGLTNVNEPLAVKNGLLTPYVSPMLTNIPGYLVNDLSPGHYLSPYEYSLISFDYLLNTTFYNTSKDNIENLSFQSFYNATYAHNLIVENPVYSSTGESFLLYEIAYYQYVLNESWTTFWNSVKNSVYITNDWSTAFNDFTNSSINKEFLVSYATDPAYSMYFYNSLQYNATIAHFAQKLYGWEDIYGIGIINHTKHLALAEKFIDWFLGSQVQNEIPLNEWMYPANSNVTLPAVYNYSVNPANVVVLNNYLTQLQISNNLPNWLEQWQTIMIH